MIFLVCRNGPGDELAELLRDNRPVLRRVPPPFQPFTCSSTGNSSATTHAAALRRGAEQRHAGHDARSLSSAAGLAAWRNCRHGVDMLPCLLLSI